MTRMILHIGPPGTGMRAVQEQLFLHRAELARSGILCPALGAQRAQDGLAAGYDSEVDGGEAAWQDLRRLIAGSDHAGVILSVESLSRTAADPAYMAALARRLKMFDEVRLVVTLRHQVELLPMLWQDLVRRRQPSEPADFIARAMEDHAPAGVWLDYRRLHDQMIQEFDAGSITLLDHAGTLSRPGGLFAALLDLALPGKGGDLAASLLQTTPADSPADGDLWAIAEDHPLALLAARAVTGRPVPDPGSLAMLAQAFGPIPGTAPRSYLTTRAEQARLLAAFEPLNEALSASLSSDLPAFRLTPPPQIRPDALFRDDMTAELWAGIATALFRSGRTHAALAETAQAGLLGRMWRRILGTGHP